MKVTSVKSSRGGDSIDASHLELMLERGRTAHVDLALRSNQACILQRAQAAPPGGRPRRSALDTLISTRREGSSSPRSK
jgi:hypothetical protein